jgi:hypothetical protein
MIITRKRLPRRTFLRGSGDRALHSNADAMVWPALGRGRAFDLKCTDPNGFCVCAKRHCHERLDAKRTGQVYQFTRILKPLEALRKDIYVLSNLDSHTGTHWETGLGDHARAGASFLTAFIAAKTAGADIRGGVSVDSCGCKQACRHHAVPFSRTWLRRFAHSW